MCMYILMSHIRNENPLGHILLDFNLLSIGSSTNKYTSLLTNERFSGKVTFFFFCYFLI